jgi:hypothetical protein
MVLKQFLSCINDKTIFLNVVSLSFTLANVEMVLKVLVLLATLVYTSQKVWKNYKGGGNTPPETK